MQKAKLDLWLLQYCLGKEFTVAEVIHRLLVTARRESSAERIHEQSTAPDVGAESVAQQQGESVGEHPVPESPSQGVQAKQEPQTWAVFYFD